MIQSHKVQGIIMLPAEISDGICSVPMYDAEFRGWEPYFGAQLETDWQAKIRRQCDVTFRALLMLCPYCAAMEGV